MNDAIRNRGGNALLKNKDSSEMKENVFEPAKLDDVSSFKEFIELDISRLSQRDLYRLRQGSFNDLIMSGYTGLFLASKNFEVEPFSINDLTKYLLKEFNMNTQQILEKEFQLRKTVEYQNEVATMFDFIMFYSKMWKIKCEDSIRSIKEPLCEDVYNFLTEAESIVYDFSKSVLIDAQLMKYLPSIVVCALITASLEVLVKVNFTEDQFDPSASKPPKIMLLQHIKLCCNIWDQFVKMLFGPEQLEVIERFGKYIIIRQQKHFRCLRVQKLDKELSMHNIYKDRCRKFYDHTLFENCDCSHFYYNDKG